MAHNYIKTTFKIWQNAGLEQVVISPGSRSAPLTITAQSIPELECFVIPDERSAAFYALGLAQASNKPVVLICTSGSAVYNYASAVAEAYFQNVPLIVCSADRPPEWIDELDGQTIFQKEIFGNHVKAFFEMPTTVENKDALWHVAKQAKRAFLQATSKVDAGPVHINWPFSEPLYEDINTIDNKLLMFDNYEIHNDPVLVNFSFENLILPKNNKQPIRILIVPGQGDPSPELLLNLSTIAMHESVVLVSDVLSNTISAGGIRHSDLWLRKINNALSNEEANNLVPDLLITWGLSIISKQLKLFLRNHKIQTHWHVGLQSKVPDTYQSNPTAIKSGVKEFIEWLQGEDVLKQITGLDIAQNEEKVNKFKRQWYANDLVVKTAITKKYPFDVEASDAAIVKGLIDQLPKDVVIHCANSLPVRYVNFFGLNTIGQVVKANRGTSGIDGSVSTALAWAINDKRPHFMICGDMSFFYDRNAWWNHHRPTQFKILILNNDGGGIFEMIPGPSESGALEDYFVTKQGMTAKYLCEEYNLDYTGIVYHHQGWIQVIEKWIEKPGIAVLEFKTNRQLNKRVFELLNNLFS